MTETNKRRNKRNAVTSGHCLGLDLRHGTECDSGQKGSKREKVRVRESPTESLGIISEKSHSRARVYSRLWFTRRLSRRRPPPPTPLAFWPSFNVRPPPRSPHSRLLVTMTSHGDYKWISETLNRPTISCTTADRAPKHGRSRRTIRCLENLCWWWWWLVMVDE